MSIKTKKHPHTANQANNKQLTFSNKIISSIFQNLICTNRNLKKGCKTSGHFNNLESY